VATDLLVLAGAIAVLAASGAAIVRSLARVASFLRISEYFVGFVILSFATSLPEMFVGINSALLGRPQIVLGNVFGANIANLTYIIGLPVLLAGGIKIRSDRTVKDSGWMVGAVVLPLVLLLLGPKIARLEGIVLLAAFAAYAVRLVRRGRSASIKACPCPGPREAAVAALIFVAALVALYFSADIVVARAVRLAADLGVPPLVISLFMVSFGTSLPELVSSVSAVLRGHTEMGVGNAIGSVVVNATAVLGVSAVIRPLAANGTLLIVAAAVMVFAAILLTALVEKGDRLSWLDGATLVLLYLLFLAGEFYLQGRPPGA